MFGLTGIAIVVAGAVTFAFLLRQRGGGVSTPAPTLAYDSCIANLEIGTPHYKHDDDRECDVLEAKTTHFFVFRRAGSGGGGGREWWCGGGGQEKGCTLRFLYR